MLTFSNDLKILVSTKPVDMRKAIDGLNGLVIEHLQINPQEKYLFLFCNQQRNKLKGIYWHKNGFVMIYKNNVEQLKELIVQLNQQLQEKIKKLIHCNTN